MADPLEPKGRQVGVIHLSPLPFILSKKRGTATSPSEQEALHGVLENTRGGACPVRLGLSVCASLVRAVPPLCSLDCMNVSGTRMLAPF